MTNGNGTGYLYDGDGRRVQKSSGKLYWYGMGSDPLDETDAAGNTNNTSFNEYIFFNGKRTARRDSTNAVNYYFADHLGTSREIVQAGQTSPCYDADFYPFGGERAITNTCPQNYKFTGKERDAESGLDNFGARYDSSSLGRFMSVDPSRQSANPANPQSWNRYAYALNNPLAYIDRNGLWPTRIHNEIYEAVFGGVLTRHQIDLIKRVSANQDSVFSGGQEPKNSNWHGQCAPGQSMTQCGQGIANHINTNLAKARAVGDVQGLSDSALTYFGIAGHALTDLPSPSHSAPDGTPTTWNGIFGEGALGHVMGERDESLDWYGIGQSVRNLIAGFVQAFPEDASKLGDPDRAAQRAIEGIVGRYYGFPDRSNSSHLKEEMARQCALGNRAACN
jgi:RHS repeat-associated protein